MGSFKSACREELSRPVLGRADSCVAQFSRNNAAVQGFEVVTDRAESIGALLGPEDWSSLQFGHK